jgi:hypothetical protein
MSRAFGSSRRFIRGPKRKELTFTAILNASISLLCQPALAIHRIRLAENAFLPKSDIGFWKVAKILHFLATFSIHPCTFVSHLELMLSIADQLIRPL